MKSEVLPVIFLQFVFALVVYKTAAICEPTSSNPAIHVQCPQTTWLSCLTATNACIGVAEIFCEWRIRVVIRHVSRQDCIAVTDTLSTQQLTKKLYAYRLL